ncbi:DNA (cytosine-5)-methyltransferase 3A-like isoform X2 [Acanthaster planci]|uniref:DNA (cytosine-5-)-methyltransferase n=1 Tax=Acanthaster planci TaxID=133434 RepID=A0A8B7YH34_ACAPL|nr:DNA (cytosine-5)-methyltransferase 3A-like isoform X2 [Acanthaster planci]
MPFYGKQSLLRVYHKWNVFKRKNLDRYIEVVHGKAFLNELKKNLSKTGQYKQSTVRQVRSQQPKKEGHFPSKQGKSSNTETTTDEEKATTLKEKPRSKHDVPQAHRRESQDQGSESASMRRRQTRRRASKGIFSATELTGDASKKIKEAGGPQAGAGRMQSPTTRDRSSVMVQDDGAFISSRTRLARSIRRNGKEGNTTQDCHHEAALAQRSEDVLSGVKGETTTVDNPKSPSFCQDKTSVEPATMSPRTEDDSSLKGERIELDLLASETGFELQKIQPLNADGESSPVLPSGSHCEMEDILPPAKPKMTGQPTPEQRGHVLRKKRVSPSHQRRTRQRSRSSRHTPGNYEDSRKNFVTNETSMHQPSSTSELEVREALTESAESSTTALMQGGLSRSLGRVITTQRGIKLRQTARKCCPQPLRGTNNDHGEQLSLVGIHPFTSTPVDKIKGFGPFSRRISVEVHRMKEPVSLSPHNQVSQPVGFIRKLGNRSPAKNIMPEVRRQDEEQHEGNREAPVIVGSKAPKVVSVSRANDSSEQDRVSALSYTALCYRGSDNDGASPRIENTRYASKNTINPVTKKTQETLDENLWNLSVVAAIEDIPLLEDDDERRKSSPNELDEVISEDKDCQQSLQVRHNVAVNNPDFMPKGITSLRQGEDVDRKPENDVNTSTVDESVEDGDGILISGNCLPGLSHLHEGPTENNSPQVDSPIIPVLASVHPHSSRESQAQTMNQTPSSTRGRSRNNQENMCMPSSYFQVGKSWLSSQMTSQDPEESTENASSTLSQRHSDGNVAKVTSKYQSADARSSIQIPSDTEEEASTELAAAVPERRSSPMAEVKTEDSSKDDTKKTDSSVSVETLVNDETQCTPELKEPEAAPRKIKTPAEKKQRWLSQQSLIKAPGEPQAKEGRLNQEGQQLLSQMTQEERDLVSGEKGLITRKRKRTDSQEGRVRGQSGWEESLRQKPAVVTKFQAGETPKSLKKPETEKKKQSPKKNSEPFQSPSKASKEKSHLLQQKMPFRDVLKPPPSKKMKLIDEGPDPAPKSSEEDESSKPTAAQISSPCPSRPLQDKYRYGQLVWGKMKGFNWWPGTVVHHHTCGRDAAASDACWIKWFGDNKFSKVNLNQVIPFVQFSAHFSQSTFLHTALYRRAVFQALQLASTRAGKTYSNDPAQYRTEVPKHSRHSNPAWQKFYELCTDMIGWAKEGFEPGGQDAIMPSEEEQQPPPRPASPPLSPVLSSPTKKTGHSSSKAAETWKDIRDTVIPEVRNGIKHIEDICIGCGSAALTAQHPFFIGGLCEVCRVEFVEMAYVYDEDGYQSFCCICAEGSDIILCDQPECYRSFCHDCIEHLVGPSSVKEILDEDQWKCFMCKPEPTTGLLTRRPDWPQKLLLFFQQDRSQTFPPMKTYPPVEMDQRKPIRVLSLFDGIGTGMLVLKELGLKVDCYFASEINEEAMQVSSVRHDGIIQQLDDIRKITAQEIRSLGPFDLLIGGSPCNDLSIANPARKGLFGTGRLFFDFYRLLTVVRPNADSQRPFFWLFENVVGMPHQHKMEISKFLECDPVVVDAKDVSPAHRARYFWGNLPGMNRPNIATDKNALCLQDCLEPNCNRQAQFSKVRTVTSKLNSIKQKNEQVLPVLMNGQEDALWCTEMERIFGFPDHYTDIANMSRTSRHRLMGQAWSVPVIKHLLAPLKEYFTCEMHQ